MLARVLASTVSAQSYSGGTEGIDAPREEELVEAAEDENPLKKFLLQNMRFIILHMMRTRMCIYVLRIRYLNE